MKNCSPWPWRRRDGTPVVEDAQGVFVADFAEADDATLGAAAPTLVDLLRRIVYTDDYVADEAAHLLDSLGIHE